MNATKLKRLYNSTGGLFFDPSHTRRLHTRIEAVATSRTAPEQVYYFVESQTRDRRYTWYYAYKMYYSPVTHRWTIEGCGESGHLEEARALIRRLAQGE